MKAVVNHVRFLHHLGLCMKKQGSLAKWTAFLLVISKESLLIQSFWQFRIYVYFHSLHSVDNIIKQVAEFYQAQLKS